MLTSSDYQSTLSSQSACNLSGIIHSWHRIITKIWDEAKANNKGTDWVNAHPINRLFAEQAMHLTRSTDWNDAHSTCEKEYLEQRMKELPYEDYASQKKSIDNLDIISLQHLIAYEMLKDGHDDPSEIWKGHHEDYQTKEQILTALVEVFGY